MSSADAAAGLVGSTFRVVEIGGAATLDGPTIELSFGDDGRVAGRATINRFFGQYEIDGDVVSVGALGTTMMAGMPEAMDQEQRFLQALSAPLRVVADGDGRVSLLAVDDHADAGSPVLLLEYADVTE